MENTYDTQKVLVVTGDVTMDWNLARTQRIESRRAVWTADDCTRMCWQRGGAALLADLVENIADKLRQDRQANFVVRQMAAPRDQVYPRDNRYHHSYATWSLFEYEKNLPSSRKEARVWRVEEFMGLDPSATEGTLQAAEWKRVVDDTAQADLVVLDDADLGFRGHSELWPKAITSVDHRPWIILKMARPVAQGDLWKHLHDHYADRLIVIMTINDLRLTEVQISRELSWEQTAQDLAWELVHNPHVNALSHCAQVVVSFNTAGAVLLSQSKKEEEIAMVYAVPKGLLFFDPKVIEGMWEQDHPGGMIGYTSCLTAGIVQQVMISQEAPDIRQGVQSGLSAMRKLHLEGYSKRGLAATQVPVNFPIGSIADELTKQESWFAEVKIQRSLRYPTPPTIETEKVPGVSLWSILEDRYKDSLEQVAQQIVLEGAEVALQGVPLGQFGSLLTVDRREIESFRSIRTLVGEYCRKNRQKRPLSIAVFGAPGSGKSFGIIEVAKSLLPNQIDVREYNLSQFKDPEELLDAFHQVRDVGLSGLIPLVFWDEFDTSLKGLSLGWLRHFLAPMQDGRFQEGQVTHPIGRSIFVFAGGVSESIETFGQNLSTEEFRAAKGPDFVSRLKGYVNIMGPNRQKIMGGMNNSVDPYYIIRRAILLRSILQREAPQLFDSKDDKKVLNIDSGVLRALLYTNQYKHGVRSMESIIAMSLLADKPRFERSCLPAVAQLNLHVDASDFQAQVQRIELEGELLEKMAEAAHEVFCQRLRDRGYSWGPQTDDELKTHSSLMPYAELPEEEKKQNRANVQDIPSKLTRVGYIMIPARSKEASVDLPHSLLEQFAEMEHERWIKAQVEAGWHWAPETEKDRKLHKDLLPWHKLSDAERTHLYTPAEAAALGMEELPDEEKEKDWDLARGIPQILAKVGYTVVKV